MRTHSEQSVSLPYNHLIHTLHQVALNFLATANLNAYRKLMGDYLKSREIKKKNYCIIEARDVLNITIIQALIIIPQTPQS